MIPYILRFRPFVSGLLLILICCSIVANLGASPVETKTWVIRTDGEPLPQEFFKDTGSVDKGPVKGLDGFFRIDFEKSSLDVEAIEKLLDANESILWYEQQFRDQIAKPEVIPGNPYGNPRFFESWHIVNNGRSNGKRGEDLNLLPAWDLGFNGAGVMVGVVDDGVEMTHPDLIANIRQDLALDLVADPGVNQLGSDDSHGTAVSGIIAASDNEIGSVGVAYGAHIVPIRYLGVNQTDADVAEALGYDRSLISIYNNSWGPVFEIGEGDAARTVAALLGPGSLGKVAILRGASNGRAGLGNIFVFSGGNDNEIGANVNYNGWANLRETIAVGSVGNGGKHVSYSEEGAPLLVCAPSGGQSLGILTTDRVGTLGYDPTDYVSNFSGTSAAAPMVSGVVALMLQANPILTWRDVQHILVKTAIQVDSDNEDWQINGAGLPVSYMYGFGRVDAAAAIHAAMNWTPVSDEVTFGLSNYDYTTIPDNNGAELTSVIDVTRNVHVEHVYVTAVIDHSDWGDLSIILTSPSGTESVLALPHEDGIGSYTRWTYSSVRHWNEESQGQWTLRVADQGDAGTGQLQRWVLTIHGTEITDDQNHDPVATPDDYVSKDYPLIAPVLANDTDTDGDTLRIVSLYQPQYGELSLTPNQEIVYTPNNTSLGIDQFGYTITDSRGGISDTLVHVTDPGPVPLPDQVVVGMNGAVSIPVLSNDFDRSGDPLQLVSVTPPEEGQVAIQDNNIVYTPSPNFVGLETFNYTVTDNNDGEKQGTVRAFTSAEQDFSLIFDGHDDQAWVEASAALDITQSITFEARFYLRSYGEYGSPGFGRILDHGNYSMFVNGTGHDIYPDHSLVVAFDLLNGNTATANSEGNVIELNRWHTVSVTYNRSTVRMFIDGREVEVQMQYGALLGSILSNPDAPLLIGEAASQERAFNGIMDWVRIWNVARPESALITADSEIALGDRNGLVGWWKFTEGVGYATLNYNPTLLPAIIEGANWCPIDPSLLSSALEL